MEKTEKRCRLKLDIDLLRGKMLDSRLPIFPTTARMSLTKLSLAGTNFIIPSQEEFGVIPAGDWKIINLFIQCIKGTFT
jgi:hypothetical protein